VELEQVLDCLADGARQTLQADAVAVRLLDNADRTGRMAFAERGQASVAATSGLLGAPGDYRSTLCVPLAHEGNPLGAIHAYAVEPGRFGEQDAALLTPLADLGASAIAATLALAALENLEASKSHFIRIATHELRSPVAVAQSLVRGVLKGYAGELTGKQDEVFVRISRRLDFLENLVNDLLDLAAGKSPGLAEEETAVVINASVGRAVLLIQPRAEEKGVALALQPCCEQLVVWGTEEGLDRIFVNLVGNAVKYTPSGGSVTVGLRRAGEDIQIEVSDTGIGIPAEALPHLFEEFYRAPNAKALNAVGTGLGLSIVRDLVDRYGGRIEVESTVGQGSTFTVTFPILADW
jgi:signal transduction histidine kinase